jgi:hypothetical protein
VVKRFAPALGLLLLLGCTKQTSQPHDQVAKPPSMLSGQQAQPPAAEKLKSQLTFTVASTAQRKAQVYLYAPDETVWIEDSPSCAAKAGTRRMKGHYQFFLQSDETRQLVQQDVASYPEGWMTFNDPPQSMLQVLPGVAGKFPDLLTIQQYATCGTTSFSVLALTPDGQSLVQYPFKNLDGSTSNIGSGMFKRLEDGNLQTVRLDKQSGRELVVTWVVNEHDKMLIATAPDYLTTELVPYQSEALGVRLSYPENFDKPESTQQGIPLTLRFRTGEVSISRTDRSPGKSLQDLARENMDANTKASNGRIVTTDLGKQQLGGEEAWGVQSYFDSAAGRTDGVLYIVLIGSFEYRVGCQTKQGPPVIPWEEVKPVCERVLGTIWFGP